MEVINLEQKFSLFDEHWRPKLIAELNGQAVKLAKVRGEFVWHDHTKEDELFIVIKGILKIEFRDHTQTIHPGEILVVPRGVEQKAIEKASE